MEKKEYYCDGLCENCPKGKLYEDKDGKWYSCDTDKVKDLKVIAPYLPEYLNKIHI